MKITGILLAAGAGTRFGGGKLLAEVPPGTPMCVSAHGNLAQAVDEVVAVVRPHDDAVRRALAAAGARVVECARAHEGMGASLACGVAAAPQAHAWIVALADMPLIQPTTIAAIANVLRKGVRIAAPSYRGERGHPVGFAAALRDELLACSGDVGARAALKSHAADLHLIATEDAGVLADIDTRVQLANIQK